MSEVTSYRGYLEKQGKLEDFGRWQKRRRRSKTTRKRRRAR